MKPNTLAPTEFTESHPLQNITAIKGGKPEFWLMAVWPHFEAYILCRRSHWLKGFLKLLIMSVIYILLFTWWNFLLFFVYNKICVYIFFSTEILTLNWRSLIFFWSGSQISGSRNVSAWRTRALRIYAKNKFCAHIKLSVEIQSLILITK